MSAILSYLTLTLPDLVSDYIRPYEFSDPLLKMIRQKGKRIRSGGTKFRYRIVKGRHSDTTQLSGTNLQVDLSMVDTFDYVEGDWPYLVRPFIFPHLDRARMTDKAEAKRWVDETTRAALNHYYIELLIRVYTGSYVNPAYASIGTLNGEVSTGTSLGFENGALQFLTPAAQVAAAGTYLGRTRRLDTTYYMDNWHNQFIQHNGMTNDFLDTAEEIKMTADSYADMEGDEGIALGLTSITNHRQIGTAIRSYPGSGGVAAVVYTVDDLAAGRTHKTVHVTGGVHYYSNRFVTDTLMGKTEAVLLLNPSDTEYHVNENMDHQMTPAADFLLTMGLAADVAFMRTQCQFGVRTPMKHGCSSQ